MALPLCVQLVLLVPWCVQQVQDQSHPVPLLFSVWYLTHFLASGAQRKQWSSSYRGDSVPAWQGWHEPH